MDLILNLLLGVFVGGYGTLVGAGGGFLLVPIFLLWHRMSPEMAVGTSLVIVTANAFSGALGYVFRGNIDYRAGVLFALATIPGAVLGAYATAFFTGHTFMHVFGSLLVLVSLYLFFKKERREQTFAPRGGRFYRRHRVGSVEYDYHEPLGLGISVGVGAISSGLGIGGGIVHVPLMTEILRFPVHIAVATSHFILAWTALTGASMHALHDHVDIRLAVSIGIGAMIGAQLGVRLSPKVRAGALIRFLSFGLLLVGIRLLLTGFIGGPG